MSDESGFRMHAERTPNPNSIMWVVGRPVVDEGASAHFSEAPTVEESPLAAQLFLVPGVLVVFMASDFITVTKREDMDWADLAPAIAEVIRAGLGGGASALGPAFEPRRGFDEGDVIERIRKILDTEVRPAVAMDGGDIAFTGFHDGIVEVSLHGACSGCPSSAETLKRGVEARLREAIPEVRGVVAH